MEIRGRLLTDLDALLEEYNPEIVEKARKKNHHDGTIIDPEGWYDSKYYMAYVRPLSKEAQLAVMKKVYLKMLYYSNLLEEYDNPVDLFKNMDKIYDGSMRGMPGGTPKILEIGNDFLKMKGNSLVPTEFIEANFRGILEKFKIIKVHIKFDRETFKETNELMMSVKWQ